MMYYTTVSGWMVSYFGRFLTGTFHSRHGRGGRSAPCSASCCPIQAKWVFMAVAVVIVGFLVCSFGLQKGLGARDQSA